MYYGGEASIVNYYKQSDAQCKRKSGNSVTYKESTVAQEANNHHEVGN